jgi:hypothetical protein
VKPLESARIRLKGLWHRAPSRAETSLLKTLATRYRFRDPTLEVGWYVAPEDRGTPSGALNRSGMLSLAWWFHYGNFRGGDYLEFGSHQGRTFRMAWEHHRRHFDGKAHFWLFDSFEGLPEPEGIDRHPVWHAGRLAMSVEDLHRLAGQAGIPRSAYTAVKGFYSDTLTPELAARMQSDGVKAAIVFVDCDLYASTVDVLEFITPLLQQGTIVCFDDWFHYDARPDRGEQLATREWLDRHPEIELVDYHLFGWHGKSFVVHVAGED